MKFIAYLLLCSCCLNLRAQNNNCKASLMELYDQFALKNRLAKQQYMHLNYTLVQYVKDNSNNKTVTEKTDFYAGENISYIKSNSANIYQNSEVAVTIVPESNTIFIFKGKSKESLNKIENFMATQDSILNHCQVTSCKQVTIQGKSYQEIVLKPSAKLSQRSHVTKITYHINSTKQEFYEIILDYDPQSLLKQTVVRFNVVDYAYKGDIFKTPPLRMVFDANNRLLPAYKSYELIDYRK